jgi:hypothetical protein
VKSATVVKPSRPPVITPIALPAPTASAKNPHRMFGSDN